jgi:hypothetical protein
MLNNLDISDFFRIFIPIKDLIYKSYMYYIYHIPGIKIGCTTEVQYRINKQGFKEFEILESHEDIYKASNRERKLQKEYGLPVDKVPYFISRNNWGSKAGKIGGNTHSELRNKKASDIGKKTWKQNFKDVVAKRRSYKGEGNVRCTITEETAINILTDYINEPKKYGLFIVLAKKYNCSKRVVQKICRRETWLHIKPNQQEHS